MKKVTFYHGYNLVAVAKVIHTIMTPAGWSLAQAKAAMEKGEVSHIDIITAEHLKKMLESVGAEDVVISDE